MPGYEVDEGVRPMPGDISVAPPSSSSLPNTASNPPASAPLAFQSLVAALFPLTPLLGLRLERVGEVDKRDGEGDMKLPVDMVRETRVGAGAAVGIGIEEGTYDLTVRENDSSIVGSLRRKNRSAWVQV